VAKSVLKFLLFLSVGLVILWFVYQNQEAAYQAECACTGNCTYDTLLDKIIVDFKSTNIFWLLMVCLAFMLSNLFRAARWKMLIEPLGYRPRLFNAFFTTMIGYLVNLALPRAGELAKPAAMSRYEKISLDKLFGTIVTDRIFDVIMLLLVTGLTFLLQFQPLWDFLFGDGAAQATPTCVEGYIAPEPSAGLPWKWIFIGGFSIGVLGVLLILLNWKRVKKTAIFHKVQGLIVNFWAGIRTVFKLRRPWLFVFYTLGIWVMYYLMTYLCFFAFAPTAHLSPLVALLVFTFGTFGMLIPSPGGMGTYQLAVTAALLIYGVNGNDGFAFANIIFFTITIFCNVFFGFLGYALLPIYNKNYTPYAPEDSAEDTTA